VDSDGTLHEWYKVMIFVGRDFLGEFSLDPGNQPELGYRRSGVAYYCPFCGEIWGRLIFTDSGGRQKSLEAVTVSCEKHPDQWNIPGSLLAGRLAALLPLLPEAAVRREFRIHSQ
jgi:hypothetical protein